MATRSMEMYRQTASFRLIYVYGIDDAAHSGCLKVGETSVDWAGGAEELSENAGVLREAARRRIDQQTKTAGVAYKLLHTEVAVRRGKDGQPEPFRDHDIHKMLTRNGVERMSFPQGKGQSEWFRTDLDTVKDAIRAVREGREVMEVSVGKADPVVFRPEQSDAIERTCKLFKHGRRMLWNAKMRFGKTLCALEVVRRCGYRRTIIFTHRPAVSDGWFEDFHKVFDGAGVKCRFGSKMGKGYPLETLIGSDEPYVYFASIQDLRGSAAVGGDFDKNELIFRTEWDCVIIDEAHEGTRTELGEKVIRAIVKRRSKVLHLSGTPFNLQDEFSEEETYTWDYVDEQRAKATWESERGFEPNPYADLPRLNILTYDLGEVISGYADVRDSAFNFREFFRVCTGDESRDDDVMPVGVKPGEFIHRADVQRFLDLMSRAKGYPFSAEEFRDNFKHTLWMLPGVKEAKALKQLLEAHDVFGCGDFRIVNVAGDGTDDEPEDNALAAVRSAIAGSKQAGAPAYTITLSCGRLTTGVTVKEWTAVFMLSGSTTTSAAGYLQTIFRVQSPGNIDGKMKTDCYAFDFAPARALVMVAEAAEIGKDGICTEDTQRQHLGAFLNFCPVIAMKGSSMQPYNTDRLLQYLKRARVERVVRSGFEDRRLYNDRLLLLRDVQLKDFEELRKIVGTTKQKVSAQRIDINNQGLSEEEYERVLEEERKPATELTPEARECREKLKKARELKETAITILRSISVRIPLLIYGADVPFDENVTPESITELTDDISWREFMPQGVSKELYRKFTSYYDREIFVAAGRRIRELAKQSDELPPVERVRRIAELFAFFRNPDKETVLTPWRVVNMHVNMVFGGYCFFDEEYRDQVTIPRYRKKTDTEKIFSAGTHLLDINAKTGLYPLLLAYNIYRHCLRDSAESSYELTELTQMWDRVVQRNIFAVCRTPMARTMTRRTLLGYRPGKVNLWAEGDTIEAIKKQPTRFVESIKQFIGGNMNIDAIIGNPPYQEEGLSTRKSPVYHLFYDVAFELAEKASLITPGRFLFRAGQTPSEWTNNRLKDPHFKVISYFRKSTSIFPSVDIKGGVVITYRDATEDYGGIGFFSDFPELASITGKVVNHKDFVNLGLSGLVSSQGIYRFSEKLFKEHPKVNQVQGKGTSAKITSRSLENLPDIFPEEEPEDCEEYIRIMGRSAGHRVTRWIRRDYVKDEPSIDTYRVFVPEANGTGAIGEVISTPVIGTPLLGTPMVGHTDTFLSIGLFKSEAEAKNCLSYVRTKFARTMLGTLKATQHNPKETWANVPMQDFSDHSDINWATDVEEIDRQLFDKYKLDTQERAFIEKMVKKM